MQFSILHCCQFLCDSRKLDRGDVASQFGKLDKVWITFLILCKLCTFVPKSVDSSGHLPSFCENIICVYIYIFNCKKILVTVELINDFL